MKNLQQLIDDWRFARKGLEKLTANMPRIIGAEGVRFVKSNFKVQGYQGAGGVKTWPGRAKVTNDRYDSRAGVKGTVYNSSSPILQQTLNLYNGIKYTVGTKIVFIGVDQTLIPYGKKMNEGGPGHWGKNATNTPARQYLPKDGEPMPPLMMQMILRKMNRERDTALGKFKK